MHEESAAMEFIYVIKRYDLFDLEFPHGFIPLDETSLRTRYLDKIERRGFFGERSYLENDSSFKQIIPYTLFSRGDDIFLLRRFAAQGESRLHNKLSIGVGGHVNPVDKSDSILETACVREITEELSIEESYNPVPVGIINDESNAVGSVHFGVVHHVRLAKGLVTVRETEMMEGKFVPIEEVKQMSLDPSCSMESWSSLIVDSMESII